MVCVWSSFHPPKAFLNISLDSAQLPFLAIKFQLPPSAFLRLVLYLASLASTSQCCNRFVCLDKHYKRTFFQAANYLSKFTFKSITNLHSGGVNSVGTVHLMTKIMQDDPRSATPDTWPKVNAEVRDQLPPWCWYYKAAIKFKPRQHDSDLLYSLLQMGL